jgi:tetratricopeptide (TPR) repeat protein
LSESSTDPDDEGPPDALGEQWQETDRYALISEIAHGGGGRISIAMDRKLGRRIAVKQPLDERGARRLEREALVMARLEHPSIVPVHDAGRDADGAPFYAMKLLGGPNLSERIREAGTFEARLALLRVVTAVADAIAYAHARGVIHRDLKPSNVVVGEFGEVAVIDWGLAKMIGDLDAAAGSTAIGAELTRDGEVMGTPAYMAPEQALGAPVDARSDVYAIGAMLYHLLAGRAPYADASGGTEVIARVMANRAPAPLATIAPDVAPDLLAIVGKAMTRVPAERYPSARELAEDLHRYETGQLVAAHRYSAITRARRWLRRHALAVASSAAAIGIASTIAVLVLSPSATRAESPCSEIDGPVRAAWGQQQRAAAARAFAATGVPYNAAALHAVVSGLDERADHIAAMRRDVCVSRAIGARSSESSDLRMACLDRRIGELQAVSDQLALADASTVKSATDLLQALGSVADCADEARLRDIAPLPSAPARRAEITKLNALMNEVRAQMLAGHETTAEAVAPTLLGRALSTGYAPQIAEMLYLYGRTLEARGRADAAQDVLRTAVIAADRARDDRLRAEALIQLAYENATNKGSLDQADTYIREARAISESVDDHDLLANLLGKESLIAVNHGDLDRGIALARESADVTNRYGSALQQAGALATLGSMFQRARRFEESEHTLTEALDRFRRVYGTEEVPDVAKVYQNLGIVAYQRRQLPEAERLLRRAIELLDHFVAPDSPAHIGAISNLGLVLTLEERFAEAETAYKSILPAARALGNTRAQQSILYNLGDVYRYQDRYDDAIAMYRECLALRETNELAAGDIARTHIALGETFLGANRNRDAIPEFETAVALWTKIEGPDGFDVAFARYGLGWAHVDVGEPLAGLDHLVKAQKEMDAEGDPHDRGNLRFELAKAKWAAGDHAAGRALAEEAKPLLAQSNHKDGTIEKVDAWLASHK